MNIKELRETLKVIKQFTAPKSTLPILGNVAVKLDEGGFRLEATNLEVACSVPIRSMGDGLAADIVTGFVQLVKVVAALDCPALVIEDAREGYVYLSGDKTEVKLGCDGTGDWPALQTERGDTLLAIMSAGVLRQVAERVAPSAANDMDRPSLMKVCAELRPDGATFVTADGFELSCLEVHQNGDYAGGDREITLLIPATALKPLVGLAVDDDEEVVLSADLPKDGNPSMLRLHFESGRVGLVQLDTLSKFPDWRVIVPRNFAGSVTFDHRALAKAVKPLWALAEKKNDVLFKAVMEITEDGVVVSAKQQDGGGAEIRRDVAGAVVDGPPLTIGLSLARMERLLKQAGKDVTMRYNEQGFSPVLWDTGDGWTAVLMPMRI